MRARLMTALILLTLVLAASPAAAQAPATPPAKPAASPPAADDAPTDRQARRGQQRRQALRGADQLAVVTDVVYAELPGAAPDEPRELTLDAAFLKHSDGAPMPAVIFIHGGGWRDGDKAQGQQLGQILALGGYFAVTIEYRLSPEAIYPAAVHDCKAAVRFLRANAAELGIDPNRIGVIGHSAGGHLAAMLGTTSDDAILDGDVGGLEAGSEVAAVVALSAPTDLLTLTQGFGRNVTPDTSADGVVQQFLGGPFDDAAVGTARAREASPITHVSGADPPTLIVHGQRDNLVPVGQARRFHEALLAAGVHAELEILRGGGHGLQQRRIGPIVAAFLDHHLGGDASAVLERISRDAPPPGRRRTRDRASD